MMPIRYDGDPMPRTTVLREFDNRAGWQVKIELDGKLKWLSVSEATELRDKLTAVLNKIRKDPRS